MPSGRDTREPRRRCRKVLVVDLGFLGDTIHTIPALRELRRSHPEAELHVVTTPVGGEVLALVDGIDRVWTVPLGNPSPPWWRHLDLQWRLFRERFDRVVNFSGADRTLFVAAFAGVSDRITREGRRGGWWRRVLAGRRIPAPSRTLPVYEQRRRVLAEAGYALGPVRFDLRIPEADAAWAADRWAAFRFADLPTTHVSINASSPFKEWSMDRWVAWAKACLARGRGPLLATGSTRDREQSRLREFEKRVADDRLVVMTEGLSLCRLAALLARCALHVGTDSGVTHLA
ncbi:MAG: glycosyltransferase family 9 protein, partial [Verrucomicrobiales bacterium]|nr:glycosyltransferase family 9 protein [Verrucomicrobiales bacterium]